jgi:hypothetical protein
MEVVRDGVMQEVLNNKTHVFVFELEGVLVGAAQTAHILEVGGGDGERVVDLAGHHDPPLLGLLGVALDVVRRRPELRRRMRPVVQIVEVAFLRRTLRGVLRREIAHVEGVAGALGGLRGARPERPFDLLRRHLAVASRGEVEGLGRRARGHQIGGHLGGRRRGRRGQGSDGRRRGRVDQGQRRAGARGGQNGGGRRGPGVFLTLGAAEEEAGDGFARQERVRLRYLKQQLYTGVAFRRGVHTRARWVA